MQYDANKSIPVNDQTGEVSDRDTGWKKVFTENLHLLTNIGGGKKSIRLFIYIIREMNNDNVLSRTQSQISFELELTRSYVSRVLTKFEQGNICVNGRGWYMMNPDLVFYGYSNRRKKAINTYYKYRHKKGLWNVENQVEN